MTRSKIKRNIATALVETTVEKSHVHYAKVVKKLH